MPSLRWCRDLLLWHKPRGYVHHGSRVSVHVWCGLSYVWDSRILQGACRSISLRPCRPNAWLSRCRHYWCLSLQPLWSGDIYLYLWVWLIRCPELGVHPGVIAASIWLCSQPLHHFQYSMSDYISRSIPWACPGVLWMTLRLSVLFPGE